MMSDSLVIPDEADRTLGRFLQDRRAKLATASFGFSSARRRTPGLRREEVAQRANISAAWYVCLEQGWGGAPSADVLDGLAKALLLTDAEREHLFLIVLPVLPLWNPEPIPLCALFSGPARLTPKVQVLLDFLGEYIGTDRDPRLFSVRARGMFTDSKLELTSGP